MHDTSLRGNHLINENEMKIHRYLINITSFAILLGLAQGCILGEDDIPDNPPESPDMSQATPDMAPEPDLGDPNSNACSGDDCPANNSDPCAGDAPPDDCVTAPVCGDGVLADTEECDDGGAADGDGCDADCAIEEGWGCEVSSETTTCAPFCGDGIIVGDEACDDSNSNDGDGCDADCAVEPGYTCDEAGCATECGDGVVAGDEACDDSNDMPGDGCSPECTIEPGFVCASSPSVCMPGCGDGVKSEFEECDDGNLMPGDGCSGGCTIDDPCVDEAAGPFVINSAEKLQCMNKHLNATYVIAPRDYMLPGDFESIGSSTEPFTGSIERAPGTMGGVKIMGLSSTSESAVGLFGRLSGATVKNLRIISPDIRLPEATAAPVGALAAGCDMSQIDDIIVTNPTIYGKDRVGGLLGISVGCDVRGVIVDATSTPGQLRGVQSVGGVIGKSENTSSLIDVRLEGDLTVTASDESAGGVIGKMQRSSLSTITTSTLTDLTISAGSSAGGLVGDADDSTISDTSLTAVNTISVTGSSSNTGGAVGNMVNGALERVTASANVSGADNVGGLVGRLSGAVVNDSHARGGTNSVLTISGGSNVGGFIGELANTSLSGTDTAMLQVERVSVTGTENVGGFIGLGRFEQGQHALEQLDVAAAQVTGDTNVGGFAGRAHIKEPITFMGNTVLANVSGNMSRTGGWFGELHTLDTTALQSIGSNTAPLGFRGDVDGVDKVGGIVGELTGAAAFHADLSSDASQQIEIEGVSNVGGFLGESSNQSPFETKIASGSKFEGLVAGERNVGGFIGRQEGTLLVRNATITANSTAVTGATNVGGIIGEAIGAESLNTGLIQLIGAKVNNIEIIGTAPTNGARATATGGLIGYASGDVHVQGNAGVVCGVYANISGEERVGGVIGEARSSGAAIIQPKVTLCNIGAPNGNPRTISGTHSVGGVIGFGENVEATDVTVNNITVTFDDSRGVNCNTAGSCGRFGGVAGHTTGSLQRWTDSTVSNTSVIAAATTQIGGGFGAAFCNEGTTANSCGVHNFAHVNNVIVNSTSVRGSSAVGGLVGQGGGGIFIQDSETTASTVVSCGKGDCGGIAGLVTNRSLLSGVTSAAALGCSNNVCSSAAAPTQFPDRAPGMGGCVGALSASSLVGGSCTGNVIVNGASSYPLYTGGAVGILHSDADEQTTVERTHATGLVNVSSAATTLPMHSGGLVGYAEPATLIEECWSNSDVSVNNTSTPNGSGDGAAGGIVGMLAGGTVKDSWASGRLMGVGDVGGIAGNISYNDAWTTHVGVTPADTLPATIIRCYVSSNLIQARSGEHAGGIIGQAAIGDPTGYILFDNLSTASPTTGSGGAGGLVGYLSGGALASTATITGNVSVGHPCVGFPSSLPTTACQQVAAFPTDTSAAPFTSWDFANVWVFSLSPSPNLTLKNNP